MIKLSLRFRARCNTNFMVVLDTLSVAAPASATDSRCGLVAPPSSAPEPVSPVPVQPLSPQPQPLQHESILRQWHREVVAHEMASDGYVRRGGRWLHRLAQAREAACAAAPRGGATDRADLMNVSRPEHKRLAASLFHLEQSIPDRAVLQRATVEERVERLCRERLRASLPAGFDAALAALDDKRRDALLRPGPEAVQATLEDERKAPPPADDDRRSSPATPTPLAAHASAAAQSPLRVDHAVRAEADWDAACQALAEEWQLAIEVLLQREREATERRAAAPAGAAPPPLPPEEQPSTLSHLIATHDERALRDSCAHVHAALGGWVRELGALAAWRPAELDAWGALSREERAAVAAAGLLGASPQAEGAAATDGSAGGVRRCPPRVLPAAASPRASRRYASCRSTFGSTRRCAA